MGGVIGRIDPAPTHIRRELHRSAEHASAIVTSFPVTTPTGLRLNQAVVLSDGDDPVPVHDKYYLPDEPAFHEVNGLG